AAVRPADGVRLRRRAARAPRAAPRPGHMTDNILFRDIDEPGLANLEVYERRGGYGALRKALTMSHEDVLHQLLVSNIRGRGGAAYIGGEETALLDSLEGKRGNPRLKPPFPANQGLFQGPTLINNVETLATVPAIIEMGGEAYAKIGAENSTGTKLVSVSGNV